MSNDQSERLKKIRETLDEYHTVMVNALRHQVEHGGRVFVKAPDLCPDAAILVCGSAVMERLEALRIEAGLFVVGVGEAAVEIDRLKRRGH